jgi:hypothetical protein
VGEAFEHGPEALVAAAAGLIGKGGGLTPEGDDLVAGAVAGHLLAGEAIGCTGAVRTVQESVMPILAVASGRTTLLSESLLRHAFAGAVADPVAALLHSLTGSRDARAALARVRRMGHSSGPALVAGVLTGVASACRKGAR